MTTVTVTETRRTIHGLRLRATGELLRVEHRATEGGYGDSPTIETVYELGTDPSYPVFDAGSAVALAQIFHRGGGHSPESPLTNGYTPEKVEPVIVEEVLSRAVRPAEAGFDRVVALGAYIAFDVTKGYLKHYPGLERIWDAVQDHAAAIEAVSMGSASDGRSYAYGRFHVVGLVVPHGPGALPEGLVGAAVKEAGGVTARRALGAIPLPPEHRSLAEGRGRPVADELSVVVCLGDARPLPPELLEALEAAPAPAPGR